MPESTTSGATNGSAVAVPAPREKATGTGCAVDVDRDVDRYRPKASTTAVHDAVLRSLASVVSSATHTAWEFLALVEVYDRDATTAIRLGHLVDASECLEIAMTHLGQLKAAMSHRLRLEDEQNTGETPF
jgi:hypothetical protein